MKGLATPKVTSPQTCGNWRLPRSAVAQARQRIRRSATASGKEKDTETSTAAAESTDRESTQDATTSEEISAEELRELASARRQQNREDNLGLIEGILDETRRIAWPSPLQALRDTVTVVGIVTLSAVLLFGLNTGLTEGSKLLYSKLGR